MPKMLADQGWHLRQELERQELERQELERREREGPRWFNATRVQERDQFLEMVGENLRGMMSFINVTIVTVDGQVISGDLAPRERGFTQPSGVLLLGARGKSC